ncbi:LuxR C-terminal-related transcriptional regulator [Phenylobacterium sp.]|uniref:LuxR C-terminal-related transcriptional regulator n=1 Tax=Phenylobacterium sp. TaxID=1871053 RepID=UPI0035B118CD
MALAELARQSTQLGKASFAGSISEAMIALAAAPPTLALVDLFTVNYDFSGIQRLLERAGPVHTLAIDDRLNPTFARLAKDAGALGYVSKNLAPETLSSAIRTVAAGEAYFPPEVAPLVRSHRSPRLSPRQLDVLKKLASGKSNKEIAEALGISPGTVKLHIHAILKLTGARNRTEAALVAGRFIAPTLS